MPLPQLSIYSCEAMLLNLSLNLLRWKPIPTAYRLSIYQKKPTDTGKHLQYLTNKHSIHRSQCNLAAGKNCIVCTTRTYLGFFPSIIFHVISLHKGVFLLWEIKELLLSRGQEFYYSWMSTAK